MILDFQGFKRSGRCVVAAVLMAFGISAPAVAGPDDDTLTVAMEQGLATVNAYFNIANEAGIFQKQVWDGLLYYDNQTNDVLPSLAESFEVVEGKYIDFTIREGVTFHDGTPFSVDDAVYTLNYARNPENGVLRRNDVNWIADVEKTGERTMRITMSGPAPGAMVSLGRNLPIFKTGAFEGDGIDGNPIGTGPYRVVEIEPGGTIHLERVRGLLPRKPQGRGEDQDAGLADHSRQEHPGGRDLQRRRRLDLQGSAG